MTKVLELISYGLTGLGATVIIAFLLVYVDEVDELDRGRKTLFDLVRDACLKGDRMISRWTETLGFGRTVHDEMFPAPLPRNKSLVKISSMLSAAIANKTLAAH
jgi:hypothetical protein